MMASRARPRRRATRRTQPAGGAALHEGFLRYANYRWLRVALTLSIMTLLFYAFADVGPVASGGTWLGYTLGTIGAAMILWLTLLGLRKRAMTPGRWSLKAWTSAHVYLGLSLIVIATLHTGFRFGWNVHTLAYILMMTVILSGLYGIAVYAFIPPALSDNREQMTQSEMLESLRAVDRQLHDAAQPLGHAYARLVQQSLEDDPFGGGLWARLTGHYPRCATTAAQAQIRRVTGDRPDTGDDPLERVDALLERKEAVLLTLRRHLRLRALLDIWLYIHVPITFALIVALTIHIVSVFFFW